MFQPLCYRAGWLAWVPLVPVNPQIFQLVYEELKEDEDGNLALSREDKSGNPRIEIPNDGPMLLFHTLRLLI